MKDDLILSASDSCPNGVINGDLEFRVAAIVRAGSKHLKSAANKRNLPVWKGANTFSNSLER